MATRMDNVGGIRRWWTGGAARRETVESGAVYAHEIPGRSVELAEVIDSATDEFGIRHIRFRLYYRYQYKIMEAGERTLAVEAFSERFTRRVALDDENGDEDGAAGGAA